MKTLDDKRILITGGTGSLGQVLVRRLLSGSEGHPARVIVFSRDEAKQHYMRMEYEHVVAATDEIIYRNFQRMLQFRIGDVRDFHSVAAALSDVDVVIMNMGGPPSLLRNDLRSDNHWIKVKLEGTRSNRSAIGATVTVEAGGLKQADAVVSQSSYISHNDARLHFGLGRADRVDKFTVRWPNGLIEQFPGAAAGRLALLVESSGQVRSLPLPK